MADKMDMATLLSRLENLCLDFQGFRHIAKQCHDKWAVEMSGYRKDNRSRIQKLFDEVNAGLQNGAPCEELIERLIMALDDATT